MMKQLILIAIGSAIGAFMAAAAYVPACRPNDSSIVIGGVMLVAGCK